MTTFFGVGLILLLWGWAECSIHVAFPLDVLEYFSLSSSIASIETNGLFVTITTRESNQIVVKSDLIYVSVWIELESLKIRKYCTFSWIFENFDQLWKHLEFFMNVLKNHIFIFLLSATYQEIWTFVRGYDIHERLFTILLTNFSSKNCFTFHKFTLKYLLLIDSRHRASIPTPSTWPNPTCPPGHPSVHRT